MKNIVLILAILIPALHLPAQTNPPARLALISESGDAAAIVDVLTAQLSGNGKVQLLERDQIEKIYREQALASANRDYLKLGQLLGADGLLLLETGREGTNQFLNTRLIAVKPGVVLAADKFAWPVQNLTEWSPVFARHLEVNFPKLTVLVKDAIPISVVNLRSALQSDEGRETERQLKLLTIQCLSHEPQFFVLERQRMQSLGEEKDLKLDDTAFWNGSYLLEGVVDQNGYSKDTVTINVRLTPPKGGAPLQLEAGGPRTNLLAVINQLVAKVNAALKVSSTAREWNAAEEATQYFEEAKWAFKWGDYPEAQAAADSAWALGKQDMDCAIIRIKSYAYSTEGMIVEMRDIDRSTINSGKESDRDWVIRHVKKISETHPGAIFILDERGIGSVVIDNSPGPGDLDHLIRALDLYYDFSQTLAPDEPKVDSTWYDFGIENLTLASMGLQHFYLVPKSQVSEANKLARLRALARSIAAWISKSPSVHASYFAVNPDPDKGQRRLVYSPNIYHCEVNWGCFWQEKPEDCVALYRELLNSPAFSNLNEAFGSSPAVLHLEEPRGLACPRLIAWNEDDRKRVSMVWGNFVQDLSNSTNQFLQAEAKLFKEFEADGLNETEIIAKYNEYWQRLKSGEQDIIAIEGQKQYLETLRAYNYDEYEKTFRFQDYSKSQASKIKPLLTAYRSNLIAQITNLDVTTFDNTIKQRRGDTYMSYSNEKQTLQTAVAIVDKLQAKLDGILGLTIPQPAEPAVTGAANPGLTDSSHSSTSNAISAARNPAATNIVLANHFLNMPQEQLWVGVSVTPGNESSHGIFNEKILTHRWRDGRLLLNLKYDCCHLNQTGDNNQWGTLGGVGLLNPENGHWDVIVYPKGGVREYGSVEFFHGNLYLVVDDQLILGGNQVGHNESLFKYNFTTSQWEKLTIQIPGTFKQTINNQGMLQLFTVNDHLYAADSESVFEIADNGQSTHILASTRRRPAASTLDLSDSLGSPVLYSGPDNFLCAIIGNGVYSWNEKEWEKKFDLNCKGRPEVFDDSILFRSIYRIPEHAPQTLWVLQKNQSQPELALYEKADRPAWAGGVSKNIDPPQKTLWPFPNKNFLVRTAETAFKADLYFFIDHSLVTTVDGHKTAVAQDGYHAKLVCLSRNCLEPINIPLKFDAQQGPLPVENLYHDPWNPWNGSGEPDQSASWMLFAGHYLFVGEDDIRGVWAIPISAVEAAVAAQKHIQLARQAQASTAVEQSRKDLLTKYDRNHNGIIDSEEKEMTLDDPAFIESELDVIDTNHNGWLDAAELGYFDANKNIILEPKEQVGIEIAQHLLAERLLKKYDANGDGLLDRDEFSELNQSSMGISAPPDTGQRRFTGATAYPDDNHDGKIDLGELETFLKQKTRTGLRLRGRPDMAVFNQARQNANQPFDPRQMFKVAVESYWQNPDSGANGIQSAKP